VTDVLATLRRNQVPCLIVAGHEWEAEHRRRLRDELPRATLTVIPNSGHFPQLADPDRFAHLLAATGAWQASAQVTPR
jgi:pimeloyl-ACP methyl ester carboxylesterase